MADEAAAPQSLHFYDLLSEIKIDNSGGGRGGSAGADDYGAGNTPAAAVAKPMVAKDSIAATTTDRRKQSLGLLERILEYAVGSLVDFSRLSRVSHVVARKLGSSESALALLYRHRVLGWFSGDSIEEVDSPIGSSESVSSSSSRSSDGFGFVPRRNRRATRVRHRVASWVGDTDPRLLLAQFNFSVPFKQQVCSSSRSAAVTEAAVTEPSSESNAAEEASSAHYRSRRLPVIEAAERMVARPTSKYRKGGPEMVVRAPSGQRCVRFDETARIPRV